METSFFCDPTYLNSFPLPSAEVQTRGSVRRASGFVQIAISLIDPYFGEQTAQAGENCYRRQREALLWGSAIYPKCGKYYDDQGDCVPNPFRPAFGYQIPIATHVED
jgi:hypothetical protein